MCTFDDNGKIRPIITATSKDDILEYINLQKAAIVAFTWVIAVGIAFVGYKLYKKLTIVKPKPQPGFTFLSIRDC
jgi:hypothetical protein